MNPIEYVNECLWPGDAVGAQYCEIVRAAPIFGWGHKEIQEAKNRVLARYNEGQRFPWGKQVRYV